jgi:hypothetical protein
MIGVVSGISTRRASAELLPEVEMPPKSTMWPVRGTRIG